MEWTQKARERHNAAVAPKREAFLAKLREIKAAQAADGAIESPHCRHSAAAGSCGCGVRASRAGIGLPACTLSRSHAHSESRFFLTLNLLFRLSRPH